MISHRLLSNGWSFTMSIRIAGYVTESYGKDGFTIKITEDEDTSGKWKNLHVSEEVRIYFRGYYPIDNSDKLVVADGEQRLAKTKKRAITIEALEKGDRVECIIYIVDEKNENNKLTYYRDNNPVNKKHYTEFDLWLLPSDNMFERLAVDTPETLKYRRQNYNMDRNRNACVNITGDSWQKCNKSWWMNKHPIIVVPYFIALWIITKFSRNSDYSSDEQLTKLNIRVTKKAIVVGIIGIVVSIGGIVIGLKIANII